MKICATKHIGKRSCILSSTERLSSQEMVENWLDYYTKGDPNIRYTIEDTWRDVVTLTWKYRITFEEEAYFYLCLKYPELVSD